MKEYTFALRQEDELTAKAVVETSDDKIFNIVHTFVSPDYRGKGLAGEVMAMAVDFIQRMDGKFKADCSYAATYLKRHNIDFLPSDNGPACRIDKDR